MKLMQVVLLDLLFLVIIFCELTCEGDAVEDASILHVEVVSRSFAADVIPIPRPAKYPQL